MHQLYAVRSKSKIHDLLLDEEKRLGTLLSVSNLKTMRKLHVKQLV